MPTGIISLNTNGKRKQLPSGYFLTYDVCKIYQHTLI